ncbi:MULTISPECIES: helix-turn-helix domain-containing protein [Vibrio]|uniref:helix-turn-helix domain-containing protein n=1 Tax=Vibrio TaxID=662 RepID=UPI0027CF0FE3|nr:MULTISPECIES: helix-turn-helix transcriptional regulator [unclassified Vibrio]EKO3771927.1 helix-turn-helix domain-containing protein [Vibrio metschnikovii]MDQ2107059.1 helix-turn-helix domain-containing protein [Vibrio sp. 2017_1457_15]MDQ2159871.1 helix-turn-helix domain-containing protein [Vibrio sp. 2017_1457_13]
MSRERLAAAIRSRRERAGFTQEEMANSCGMSKKTYQRIEQGKTDIKLSQYESILRSLNLSELDLVLDKLDYDDVSNVDLLALSRLLPKRTRRLMIDLFFSLHADINQNKSK